MRRRPRDVVRVHVPSDQAPLFYVPGPHGGLYISLLYGHGYSTDVPIQELRKLLAGSRGETIIARRLTRAEAGFFERRRVDCDADAHAFIISKDEEQFRRPRRGDNRMGPAKPAVRKAIQAGNKPARPQRGGA